MRRKASYWLVVAVAIISSPLMLPLLALRVTYETWLRGLQTPPPRRRGWERIWSVYGHHLGLYRLSRWMQRRLEKREEDPEPYDPDDWFAEPTDVKREQ